MGSLDQHGDPYVFDSVLSVGTLSTWIERYREDKLKEDARLLKFYLMGNKQIELELQICSALQLKKKKRRVALRAEA